MSKELKIPKSMKKKSKSPYDFLMTSMIVFLFLFIAIFSFILCKLHYYRRNDMESDKITVELTSEEFAWVNYCVEFITANERSFDMDDEKILKSIAKKFDAEYNEEANLNYINEDEE